jgi:ligand-binding SRPBCC domain-containing protein
VRAGQQRGERRETVRFISEGDSAMTRVYLETYIAAPPERCFDLARDLDLHAASMARSRERAIGGVTTGPMELGDTVTWQARHLGVTRTLTSRMIELDPPRRFADEQVRGPFAWFRHVHEFHAVPGGTLMTDAFTYEVPYGRLGRLGDRLVLARYMRRLLTSRSAYLKRVAEGVMGDG